MILALVLLGSATIAHALGSKAGQKDAPKPARTWHVLLESTSRQTIGMGGDKVTVKFRAAGDLSNLKTQLKRLELDQGLKIKLSPSSRAGDYTIKTKAPLFRGDEVRKRLNTMVEYDE
jgi:hypothetical protein